MLSRRNTKSKEENSTQTSPRLMNSSTEIKNSSLQSNKAVSRNCNMPSESDNLSIVILAFNSYSQRLRNFTFNWSYNNMKSFLKELNNKEQSFYHKVYLIAGITHDPKTISDKQMDKAAKELTNSQTFDLCRFSNRQVYSNMMKNTGNTCLHVAGEYGNMSMLNYILKNNVVDCNLRNSYGDTTLMHTLRNSNSNSFQKSVLLLSKYSDLNLVDGKDRRPDEITLASYSKSRARIMQFLQEEYIARTKQ